MTSKEWEALKDGDIVYNKLDGYNKIKEYPYNTEYRGKRFMLSCDKQGNETGTGLFELTMFDCRDWKLVSKNEQKI